MPHQHKRFVVIDPRLFDGNPFDVADRAVGQVAGLVELSLAAIADAKLMARNAELERQCQAELSLDAYGWDTTPEARKWHQVEDELSDALRQIRILQKVAGYDPKNPPKV